MKKLIKVMDTSYRDGFQSVFGARVLTKDFLPALESAVNSGLKHFEMGGGARFQVPIFYCNENAFDMMDKVRETVGPDVNLQTLSRGVNVVGLVSQTREVIDLHAKMFKKHGVTTIRNFDALNDVNNLIDSANSIHNHGLKHEVTITLMDLPIGCEGAHDVEFYRTVLKNILDSGLPFDSLAFKDASGTSHPRKVYETVKMAREMLGADAHIRFHSHETAGTGLACYLAALDGGADGIDLAMKPVSGGTSQPDMISMWHALRDTEYDLGLDIKKIIETEHIFKECMKDYYLSPEAMAVNPLVVQSPLPGGALTTNTVKMREAGIMDKFPEVLAEMEEVVKKGGFGTSVTPVSQFYYQQAFTNVMQGRWKKISDGYGKMVLGYFGKTPCQPDEEIVKLASEQLGLEKTTEKVVDLNEKDPTKGLAVARKMLQDAGLEETEENLFIAAACTNQGIDFLLGKGLVQIEYAKDKVTQKTEHKNGVTVSVNGKNYSVKLDGNKAIVNGKSYDVSITDGVQEQPKTASSGAGCEVKSPLPGAIIKVMVKAGDSVKSGDTLLIMEAMKMETTVQANEDGVVKEVFVNAGDQVQTDQVLVKLG